MARALRRQPRVKVTQEESMSPAPKRPKAGSSRKLALRKQTVKELTPDARRSGRLKGGVTATGGLKTRHGTFNCPGNTARATA
jgi:hypothetical protein